MTNHSTESSQGEGGIPLSPAAGPTDNQQYRGGNVVFKSGHLLLSSKGIGWTSWKKRWFILTRTSLVFFRSNPNAVPQKGSEVNITLGGIDLNNTGSVVVKADKKLLTVLFPDGRDGRAFTLKAETLEDLNEWKDALENALLQAPSASVVGENGTTKNGQVDAVDAPSEELKDKQPFKAPIVGRPVLLALEEVDGSPSFLEKALRFVEEHGVKTEGILRQAADVDDVDRRVREYEQGKTDFSPDEDAHVIGDCIKYILREMPSSPVPASCCKALLEAFRTDRALRLDAMREAICETFPEPNRRLLQRILLMMQVVAANKEKNRMNSSAVAACMAPLLLRPLLAGDCEIENDFDVGGDSSAQLLQAAAAANHAQAIVVTLLEEYNKMFMLEEGTLSSEMYADEEDDGTESEEATDDDDDDDDYSYEEEDGTDGSYADSEDHLEYTSDGESGYSGDDNMHDEKDCDPSMTSKFLRGNDNLKANGEFSSNQHLVNQCDCVQRSDSTVNTGHRSLAMQASNAHEQDQNVALEESSYEKITDGGPSSCMNKSASSGPPRGRHPTVWGRMGAKKNLSMESMDSSFDNEDEIQKLKVTKAELEKRVAEEVKGNAALEASLEGRRKDLHEHRLALERDISRLQDQLNKERELRKVLEAAFNMSHEPLVFSASVDEKTKADLKEIALVEADVMNLKQLVDDLGMQLQQQREQSSELLMDKAKDPEIAYALHLDKSTGSKGTFSDGAAHEKEGKRDSKPLPNKASRQNQQSDPAHSSNLKSAPTKRSTSRGEGSAGSALSKLANKFRRRKEIANENSEKNKALDSRQTHKELDNSQDSEKDSIQSLGNNEKGIREESLKKSGSRSKG